MQRIAKKVFQYMALLNRLLELCFELYELDLRKKDSTNQRISIYKILKQIDPEEANKIYREVINKNGNNQY
jgi:hypothetical protein